MDEEIVLRVGADGMLPVLERVHQEVELTLARGAHSLFVDVSELAELSSTSVAALLWIRRRASERGAHVVVRGARKEVRGALRRLGFESFPRPVR